MARPILLLHGFASSPRVMSPLAARLEKRLSRRVIAIRTSRGGVELSTSARHAALVLDELAAAPDFEFADVVGHSMGGLIGSYLLKRIDRGTHIRRVITLGSPHRGSPLAPAASLLMAGLSPAMRAMVPGSRFLSSLEWAPVPVGSELVSIASTGDALVPAAHAAVSGLPRHRNIVIDGVSHLRLVFSGKTLQIIADALRAPSEGACAVGGRLVARRRSDPSDVPRWIRSAHGEETSQKVLFHRGMVV